MRKTTSPRTSSASTCTSRKDLLEANIQKDPEIIKEVIKLLRELREAWDKISATEARTDKANIESKGSFSIEG